MILNDKEAVARLSSPMNLMNKLKSLSGKGERKSAMSLFIRPSSPEQEEKEEVKETFNPFESSNLPAVRISTPTNVDEPTKLDDILDNNEAHIQLGLAHDNAIKLLNRSVDMLATKLDDVKADKLPAVISAAAKTVEGIRRERNEAIKNNKDKEVHYHFYTPEQKKVTDYEIIEVA